MNELTLKIDYYDFFDTEIQYYLSTLNGIYGIKINASEDEIYVKNDSNIISEKKLLNIKKKFN